MIFELRVLKSALVAVLVSITLVFVTWEIAFPAFALAYLAYKYAYYRRQIGADSTNPAEGRTPGRLLEKTLLLFVLLLVVTRGAVFPLVGDIWSVSALSPPVLDLSDLGALLDQLGPILSVWGSILVPLGVISYAVGHFRLRLLAGTDSREAAVRAALWESFARVPIYLLWAGLAVLGPVYEFWVRIPEPIATSAGVPIPSAIGFAPVLGDVFPVVVAVGHVVPALVIGAYLGIRREKYDDWTVPEVLGYRGLYPPNQIGTRINIAVPILVFLLYAGAVVGFNGDGPAIGGLLILPTLVTVLAGADVKGVTSRLARAVPNWLPGSGGDAVIFGFCIGLYTLGLLAAVGAAVNIGLTLDPVAALYFPVLALPLAFGANWVVAIQKSKSIERLVDRVEADPGSIEPSEIDRLLAYAAARKERLRATAIEGLATAVWASTYKQQAIIELFESVLESGDEQFARPGLKGIVMLFRGDSGIEATGRLTDTEILTAVIDNMENPDVPTRALAAEAFCRIVETGYQTGYADQSLTELAALPIEQVETIVEGEGGGQYLTDAAVECFARLWYDRNDSLDRSLSDADKQTLLVDLVWWAEYANDLPRSKAAYAVTSTPAVVETPGLASIRELTDSDVALVRLMAAHVLGSSMERHADEIDPDHLLPLLNDEGEGVRWAGAEAIHAYVDTTETGATLMSDLVAHLEAREPATAGSAEATVLETLSLLEESTLTDRRELSTTVAGYVASENRAVAEPAARLLATFITANPRDRHDGTIMDAIETGLTHESDAVREHCIRTAAAIVGADPADGRPFIKGLVLNLGTTGDISEMAVSVLAQILEEYPEYGTEFLPEMVGGIRNPTSISKQYAGSMLVGRTVSQVTTGILADITDHDVSRGDVLVDPLVDLAGNAGGGSRESVFKTLANLSAEYPDETREALSAAQAALDEGSVRVRRNAAQVLSNVALEHPEAVAPFVSSLTIAIDDSDPQTRSIALVTIGTVGASNPDAIESDVRRVIGRLEDDSSMVREHAAKAIITIAERQPDVVEPTAEASDRLRRLQRDPAVDVDEELLQQAANAVRTGTPPGQDVGEDDETDIFTPESADEVGQSGDTRVFDPSAADLDDDPTAEEATTDGDTMAANTGPADTAGSGPAEPSDAEPADTSLPEEPTASSTPDTQSKESAVDGPNQDPDQSAQQTTGSAAADDAGEQRAEHTDTEQDQDDGQTDESTDDEMIVNFCPNCGSDLTDVDDVETCPECESALR